MVQQLFNFFGRGSLKSYVVRNRVKKADSPLVNHLSWSTDSRHPRNIKSIYRIWSKFDGQCVVFLHGLCLKTELLVPSVDKRAKKYKNEEGQKKQQKGSDADGNVSPEEDGYLDSKEVDYLADSSSSSESKTSHSMDTLTGALGKRLSNQNVSFFLTKDSQVSSFFFFFHQTDQ